MMRVHVTILYNQSLMVGNRNYKFILTMAVSFAVDSFLHSRVKHLMVILLLKYIIL